MIKATFKLLLFLVGLLLAHVKHRFSGRALVIRNAFLARPIVADVTLRELRVIGATNGVLHNVVVEPDEESANAGIEIITVRHGPVTFGYAPPSGEHIIMSKDDPRETP